MGRNPGSIRHLRRVGGDVHLAPVKIDACRPTSPGFPLKRCSNETKLNLHDPVSAAASTNFQDPNFRTKCRKNGSKDRIRDSRPNCEVVCSSNDSSDISSSTTPSSWTTTSLDFPTTNPKNSAAASRSVTANNWILERKSSGKKLKVIHFYKKREGGGGGGGRGCREEKCHERNESFPIPPRPPPPPSTRNAINVDECSSTGATLSKFCSCSTHYPPPASSENGPPVTGESTDEQQLVISTATTLDLPHSQQAAPPISGEPSEWSMKNQVTTPQSQLSSSLNLNADEGLLVSPPPQPNTTTTTVVGSQVGDGDSSSPPGSTNKTQEVNNSNSAPVPPTAPPPRPVSAVTSLMSDKPVFTLAFRKPKPRPRSIITNKSSSVRSSLLPTTASTPNPTPAPTRQQGNPPDGNNDTNERRDTNNNDELQAVLEENNNVVAEKVDGVVINEKGETYCGSKKSGSKEELLPKDVFSIGSRAAGQEVEVMPARPTRQTVLEPAPAAANENEVLDTGAGLVLQEGPDGFKSFALPGESPESLHDEEELENLDESFWKSDSTVEEKKPRVEGHQRRRGRKSKSQGGRRRRRSTQVEGTNSKSEVGSREEGSGSGSGSRRTKSGKRSYPYPMSLNPYGPGGYGYGGGGQGYSAAEYPFIQTEKGAIRFHLPGRIQHKTTIKVAHFPTGDEKNVVVNLQPEKEEEQVFEDPTCANNQNFVVPPPPPLQYPSPSPYDCYQNPYAYGGGGGYPPYPSYYGYPPYC